MKSLSVMLLGALISLSTVALGWSGAASTSDTDAQKSFKQLKTLAGTWQGPITVDPPMQDMKNGTLGQVALRVTSRGNALMHEMYDPSKPDDPNRFDHPLTMLYLDGEHLTLIHYCDAGNRPRMVAQPSPDGKKVEFDFADLSGGNEHGHMYHAVFTIIDSNHHIEDWTYMMPGDKPVHAHFDLQRKNGGSSGAGK
jgi:hypothetical protein